MDKTPFLGSYDLNKLRAFGKLCALKYNYLNRNDSKLIN